MCFWDAKAQGWREANASRSIRRSRQTRCRCTRSLDRVAVSGRVACGGAHVNGA